MYFEDTCLKLVKVLIWSMFITLLFTLNILNYDIGIFFCKVIDIPKDFALTMVSPGMAINITIILFTIEMFCLFNIIKVVKRIKVIDEFFKFLCDFEDIY